MDKSGVKVRGKGHNVVVDSEKVVVDSEDVQLNTVNVRIDGDKPDLDAALEALARLGGEIDALQIEPKYKRRSDDVIKTIEEELVDAVPSPETVQSSLEGHRADGGGGRELRHRQELGSAFQRGDERGRTPHPVSRG